MVILQKLTRTSSPTVKNIFITNVKTITNNKGRKLLNINLRGMVDNITISIKYANNIAYPT